jgi:hypothetical protein
LEVDEARYNTSMLYRDEISGLFKDYGKKRSMLERQECRLFAKMLSLLDIEMAAYLKARPNWSAMFKAKDPRALRNAIRVAVLCNAGNTVQDTREDARDEWAEFAMSSFEEHLTVYETRFNDLTARSTLLGLEYTAEEQAAKFLKGLSPKWVDLKVAMNSKVMKKPTTLRGMIKAATTYLSTVAASAADYRAVARGGQYAAYPAVLAAAQTFHEGGQQHGRGSHGGRSGGRGSGGRGGGAGRGNGGRGRGGAGVKAESKDTSEAKAGAKNQYTAGGKPICNRCGGVGHMAAQCPTPPDMEIAATFIGAIRKGEDRSRMVLLDSGAQVSLFANRQLVDDVQGARVSPTFHGFTENEDPLVVEEEGNFEGVPVYFSEGSAINILGEHDAADVFHLYKLEGWGTRAVHKETGEVYDFLLRDKLQWLDLDSPVDASMGENDFLELYSRSYAQKIEVLETTHTVASLRAEQADRGPLDRLSPKRKAELFVSTVADRAQLFTKAEMDRAKLAQTFIRNSCCRGKNKILKSMRGMTGLKFTAKDVEHARFIWGPLKEEIKGRARNMPVPPVSRDIKPPKIRVDVKLEVDVMEVLGKQALVAICRPHSLALMAHVKDTKAESLYKALQTLVRTCEAFRLQPTEIVVDPEKTLGIAGRMLGDIPITGVGTGCHVVGAENLIQVLKDCIRVTIHGLPWDPPPSLIPPLMQNACRRRNALHTDVTDQRPLEVVTGVPVDAREFDFGPGDQVQVYVKPKRTNQMTERSRDAIVLYPIGRSGNFAVRFLDTWTDGMAHPNKMTLIPTSQADIDRMNERCRQENPSQAYRNALKMEREAGQELAAREGVEEAPRLVDPQPLPEEPLDDDDEAPPQLLDDVDSDDDSDDDADDADVATDVAADVADGESVAGAEDVAPEVTADAAARVEARAYGMTKPGEVRMLRSGNKYQVMVMRRDWGVSKFRIGAMKKGASKSTLKAALRQVGARQKKSLEAAVAELTQIDEKGSWVPVHKAELTREEVKGIIRSFLFIIDKFTPEGELLKVKARLVAMGNQQNPDAVGMDASAPTVTTTSVMIGASIAGEEHRHKMTCDVGGAFLHSIWPKKKFGRQVVLLDRLNTSILVKIRPEYAPYVREDGTLLMSLEKALYGLVQAARLWYDKLCSVLKAEGYVMNPCDPCVWNKGPLEEQCSVFFHVDDLFCSCRNLDTLKELEAMLIRNFGEEFIKCRYGDDHEYLGMRFEFLKDGTVRVTMPGYIQAVLETAGVGEKESAKTPANANLFLLGDNVPKLDAKKGKEFHSLVQALSYLSQRVRWDLLLTIGFLKTRVNEPDEFDWQKLRRCLAYLNATRDIGCRLGVKTPLGVDASIDASHAVYENGRSQGGLAVSLGLGVVCARSHKLTLNTKSSAESELVTTSDNVPEAIWAREFLLGQGYDVGPAQVRQDNQAAIRLLERGRSNSRRTKHINTRFFFVHDRIEKGEVILTYTRTEEMVADFFTKPLQGALFLKMRDRLLGVTDFS